MSDPIESSDESTDEECVLRDFDKEIHEIINSDTLPKKSSDRYLQVYEFYHAWLSDNEKNLSSSHENNLIIYFKYLKEKCKPPTLWSIWSMLKKTLNAKDEVDISRFLNLKAILKTNSKGYKPKKSLVLEWDEISKFIKEANDFDNLAMKVILIFGISGALRCDEIYNLKVNYVEDLKTKYLVSIKTSKNDYSSVTISASRQLIIGPLFYDIVKKYISLRPVKLFSDKFFVRNEKIYCTHQVIGINKIYETPSKIAEELGLKNPKLYTGHCYRRTGASLLAESGANSAQVRQLGGWIPEKVAIGKRFSMA
ncbi:hypothetical protein TKK_0015674 [Trichogramma kaykai]